MRDAAWAPLRGRAPLLIASGVLAAGCGSTVAGSGVPGALSSGGPGGANGVAAAQPDTAAGPGTGLAAAASGRTIGAPGTPAVGPGTPADTAAAQASARSGVVLSTGPGVTPTTISIGLVDITDTGAAIGAQGLKNVSTGDMRQEQQAMVDYVNRHGGVAGRRLVPVWFEISAESTSSAAQNDAAGCAAFTEDHKVFAVIYEADDAQIASCLTSRGVTMITSALRSQNSAFYARFPAVINIANLNLDRMSRAWIPELARAGYFKGWDTLRQRVTSTPATVGLVVRDEPQYTSALHDTLLPTLAHYGFRNPDVELISVSDGAGAQGESAAVGAAELRFKSDGVDHVLFLESNGDLAFAFANAAYSQHYFPRYGVNSQDALGYLVSSGNVPAQTAEGALGIGWTPLFDLKWGSPEATSPARTRCDAIMRAAGITASNNNNEINLVKFCDSFLFLQASAGGLNKPTQASLLSAIDRLGGTFASGYTMSTFFSAAQHDGAASYRATAYEPSCTCLVYRSGPHDIG